MSILQTVNINNLKQKLFLDPNGTGIARYDQIKYNVFDRLTKEQKGFFWQPEEINLSKDAKDWTHLYDHEKDIFRYNLSRQITLDSVQGRAPALAFLPFCTLPELESWIIWWTASEQVHSYSYTYIIRNLYSDPSVIFDHIMDIPEVVDCADDISKYYDELDKIGTLYRSGISDGLTDNINEYEVKKAIWLALNAVNALEGIRFYVSFACAWAFAELKKMEGNAKIIRLIARDEALHLGSTQTLIKLLPKDDPDFKSIANDPVIIEETRQMFKSVIDQEKDWARFLFQGGSMIGLSEPLLRDYVDFISTQRMSSIGLEPFTTRRNNPLPWTMKWIDSRGVQTTPQQAELSSYILGEVKQDISEETFKDYDL